MPERKLRRDLEGDFYQATTPEPHLVKRLSLETAWLVDDLFSLEYSCAPLVERVTQDGNVLLIHYAPEVQLLELETLRDMLHLGGPFAGWRFARLALELASSMELCHNSGIPQLVVHPQRIALFRGSFALLPSLAGVLSPFPSLLAKPNPWWLQYLAPEVLRTRGTAAALLQKGGVYSLAKTLLVLLDPAWVPIWPAESAANLFNAVEALVERPQAPLPQGGVSVSPDWEKLVELLSRAAAPFPQERPVLAVLVSELEQIYRSWDTGNYLQALISTGDLAAARRGLDELKAGNSGGVFVFPEIKIHLYAADLALAQSPPNFAQAIGHLERARTLEPESGEIWVKIGRSYRRFTDHEQHALLASEAYLEALARLGWPTDLLEEWLALLLDLLPELPPDRVISVLETLARLGWPAGLSKEWLALLPELLPKLTPDEVISATVGVPLNLRTQPVCAWRAASFEAVGQHELAWEECAVCLKNFGFDEQVFATAEKAAESIDPLDLLAWKVSNEGEPELVAMVSIVWARNGNEALAARCRDQARRLARSNE